VPPGPGSREAWRRVNPEREAEYEARRRGPIEERSCVGCGTAFSTSRRTRLYCSRLCGDRHRERAYRARLEAQKREQWALHREKLRRQLVESTRRAERLRARSRRTPTTKTVERKDGK
jgi:hypothetical protein